MTLLPSQVERFQPEVDFAFGADLAGHPYGWDWTSATADLLLQSIPIKRGRSDEADATEPTTTGFTLDNPDGLWTPAHPQSPHWPHMDRGTSARIWLPGGPPHVALDGDPANNVSTPDHSSLDILGDIDLRGELDIGWWDVGSQTLIGKWETTGNQRSYLLRAVRTSASAGAIGLLWSTDGTAAGTLQAAAVAPIMTYGAVRGFLDVNNGAGGWTAYLYWAPSLDDPWQLITTVTGVGTTSIFNSTAPLRVGPHDPTTSPARAPFIGAGYRFEVRDSTGTLVAAPDFTTRPIGAASFTDAVGRTWTFNGAAAVTDRDVRCFGQVASIAPKWPHGDLSTPTTPGDSRVDITIAGILRRLSQGKQPLSSTLYRVITSPSNAASVYAYWPLEEGRDATQAASPIPGVRAGIMAVPFAVDDTLDASAPLPSQSGGQPLGWNLTIPPTVPTTGWEVTFFVKIPTPAVSASGDFTTLMRVDTKGGTLSQWVIRIDDADLSLFAKDLDGVNVLSTSVPSDDRMFGTWAIVALNITQSGADVLYDLDFIPIPLGVVFGLSGTLTSRTCGRPTGLRNLAPAAPPDGISVGHFIVTVGKVAGWLAGADTAWEGETAAHRFWRLCLEENIPAEIIGDELVAASFRGDPAKSTQMGPQGRKPLPDLLAECAATELGILFEQQRRPGLGFRTRRSLYNQAVALDLDAAIDGIANPFAPAFDDQALRNEVTVQREGGSSHTETTDPPPDPLELYNETVTVNVFDDRQLIEQAGARLALGTWPGMRYRTVTSELTTCPDLMDPWRAVRLGDRVQVRNLPPQHPAAVVDLLAQGWTETISPTRWKVEANCTPGGPWVVGVLDDDPTAPDTDLARLDSAGSTLSGAIDEDDLSFTVAVAGPLWTTDSDYFPLDVEVGGEVVTLSAISGASSPQTFTASARSVNGVRKAHAAGTEVHVANPIRLAY